MTAIINVRAQDLVVGDILIETSGKFRVVAAIETGWSSIVLTMNDKQVYIYPFNQNHIRVIRGNYKVML
jgi:hypothetical protein